MQSVRLVVLSLSSALLLVGCEVTQVAQAPTTSGVVVFEGARLITGDGSPAVEDAAFIVENNHFTAVGRK